MLQHFAMKSTLPRGFQGALHDKVILADVDGLLRQASRAGAAGSVHAYMGHAGKRQPLRRLVDREIADREIALRGRERPSTLLRSDN